MILPLRDENPTRRYPLATIALLLINVAVFLYEVSLPAPALEAFVVGTGVIPAEFATPLRFEPHIPLPLTLLTSMFVHGSLAHLAGNMLYLWVFGNNVEDASGRLRFLTFYLLCGAAAAFTQIASAPRSTVPMIGASGAIAGVMGAYMLLYPHARVLTLVFIRLFYLPAVLVLGFYFLLQVVLSTTGDPELGGVAFFAHIGGFVAGMILIWPFRRRRRPPRDEPLDV